MIGFELLRTNSSKTLELIPMPRSNERRNLNLKL
jgi:hypothetical protein